MTASLIRRISNAAAFFPGKFTAVLLIALAVLFCVPTSANAQLLVQNGENANDILGQYNSSTMADNPADYVKGCDNDGASPFGFNTPSGGTIDATNHWLFIADSGNNRVLVYTLTSGNLISSKTPTYVLGQANFLGCSANEGGGTTGISTSLSTPSGLAVDPTNHLLYVSDYNNNRIMVFNTASGTMASGEAASYVIGQTSLTGSSNGDTQSTLSGPSDVALDTTAKLLYVADMYNHRVMVFPSYGGTGWATTGENATYVLGQASWTSLTAATSTTGLRDPSGVAIDITNHRLYVADSGNNRVMIFSTSPIFSDEAAIFEIGQPPGSTAFTTATAATTQSGLSQPQYVTVDTTHNRLFVSDMGNNREMIFPTPVTANGENASNVLGQTNFTTANSPYFATYNSGHDYGGQSEFAGAGANPGEAVYDATNNLLYLTDSEDHRVMIFNVSTTVPTASSPTQSGSDACGIASGLLFCWGGNSGGEDGLGYTGEVDVPQQVGSATTWTAVSQGDPGSADAAACGLQSNGTLWCWGNNAVGEDGVGNTTQQLSPVQEDTLSTNWTAVSQGGTDACGIKGGTLWCWGANNSGQDGLNNGDAEVNSPTQVGAATTWTKISQSGTDACGIQSGGALYCWGGNGYGEDGVLNTTEQDSPVQVGNSNTVFVTTAAVASGAIGSVAAANTVCQSAATAAGLGGSYKAWIATTTGTDDPNTTFTHSTVPYKDVAGNTIAANWTGLISGTLSHAINTNQTGTTGLSYNVWTNVVATTGAATTSTSSTTGNCAAWTNSTSSDKGNFGLSSSTTSTWSYSSNIACNTATNHLYCVQQDGGNAWASVSQGQNDTCAITTGGKLYCWGHNFSGEVGVGNTHEYNNPTQVGAATNWTAVSIEDNSDYHASACGIAGGELYCWGSNDVGQQGNGGTTSSTSPGTAIPSPPSPATLTGWTAVEYKNGDACGINNGELYCWGQNASGEDGNGNGDAENNSPVAVPLDSLVSGENATDLLGEYGSASSTATVEWAQFNDNNSPNMLGLSSPNGVALDPVNHALYVSDPNNFRVLVYDLNPDNSIITTSGGHTPSYVINTTSNSYLYENWLGDTYGLAVDSVNNRLFVTSGENAMVMVYNTPITSNNPDPVAGEVGSAAWGYNAGGCTSALMNNTGNNDNPTDVAYDSVHNYLYVVDSANNRVLVFIVAPGFTSGKAATYVLGQSGFTTCTSGDTAAKMNTPEGLAYDSANSRLFVADAGNNRVLVFNTASLSSGMSATNVIGQASFTVKAAATSQTGLTTPNGVAYDATTYRLFVADAGNNRVLVYKAGPSVLPTYSASAAYVLGQSSFSTGTAATTQSGLSLDAGSTSYPNVTALKYDPGSGRLFVPDQNNNRIMIFPAQFMPSWPPIMAP